MVNLEETLVEQLIQKGYHIAFAESCTGGMVCARIVNVPNASKVLNSSFITYSNEAKIKFLHISPATLDTYGAVSEETAQEMASGAAKAANSEIGVGVTGIAGPSGGTAEKPVGMVCFGIHINGRSYSYTEYFHGKARNDVRKASVEFVLKKLIVITGN